MNIVILNASNPQGGSNDSYVDFRQGRASCFSGDKEIKTCRSWHSWAYALETEFLGYLADGWERVFKADGVVILANRDADKLIPLVSKLKLMKKKVFVSYHEGVQDLIERGVTRDLLALRELVKHADGYICIFPQMLEFFRGFFDGCFVETVLLSAPLDHKFSFTKPFEERTKDVLIGTRTFGQRLSRNTLVAMCTAHGVEDVQNIHFLAETPSDAAQATALKLPKLMVHQGPLAWGDWLRFISDFKCIVHSDQTMNIGQIAFDAALVDVMVVGSTTSSAIMSDMSDQGSANLLHPMILQAMKNIQTEDEKYFRKEEIHPDSIRWELLRVFGK